MSLYLGNNLIAPNQSNAANKSLSNLDATGQAVIDGKVDVDFNNVTDTANILMAHNAMPSDTFVNLTLGASGSNYTAPTNGYFFLNKVAGSDWYYIRIAKEGSYDIYDSDYRTTPLTILFPVKKNDIITVTYNATGTTNAFRFIYAQGSESEAS